MSETTTPTATTPTAAAPTATAPTATAPTAATPTMTQDAAAQAAAPRETAAQAASPAMAQDAASQTAAQQTGGRGTVAEATASPGAVAPATATDARARRETFRIAEAPLLHETGMMSMPVMNPKAPEQFWEWAAAGGQVVKVLFGDPDSDGISLVWSRFSAGFVLPRHSHSADCLYYVTRGELRMGQTVLGEGDGFFQPADRPYTYTAGPDGVEVLEFRTTSPFDMQITESLPGWDRVVAAARANRDAWAAEAKA